MPIHIAIIDRGVNPGVGRQALNIASSIQFIAHKNGDILQSLNAKATDLHGTEIALVIRRYCDSCVFHSISMLNERRAPEGRLLAHALRYAITLRPEVITICRSTAISGHWAMLQFLSFRCKMKGIIIVAAGGERGKMAFPDCMTGVIKTKSYPLPYQGKEIGYSRGWFYGPQNAQGIDGLQQMKCRLIGNNASAAIIAGHIARLISEHPGVGSRKIIAKLKTELKCKMPLESK
jgi:hypothetical protein